MKINPMFARAGVAVTSLALAGAAQASEGTDAIAALGTEGALYITAAFALAVTITTGFWGIRMFKKAARAAS